VSLVLLDVDHFKAFNDAFGHTAGDDVLRALARLLRANTRGYDVVARYGGEEFAVLLPDTGPPEAHFLAERLRLAIEQRGWPRGAVTASLGTATLHPSRPASSDLVDEADRALYRSKRLGRNRVSTFEEVEAAST